MKNLDNSDLPKSEPIEGKTYLADGWKYFDFPNLSLDYFEKLVNIIGENNIVWLTIAERTWPDGLKTKRGQVLISPTGIDNIKKI